MEHVPLRNFEHTPFHWHPYTHLHANGLQVHLFHEAGESLLVLEDKEVGCVHAEDVENDFNDPKAQVLCLRLNASTLSKAGRETKRKSRMNDRAF